MTAEICLLNDPEAVGLRAASIFRDLSKIAVVSTVSGLISPVAGEVTWLIDREAFSQFDVAAMEYLGILKDTGC